MSDKPRFDTIEPVSVDLTRADAGSPRPVSPGPSRQRRVAVIAGIVLTVLAVVVIFLLPDWVAQRESAVVEVSEAPRQVTGESPYREAQLREARRESQDILAQLLEAQDSLKAGKVDLWAPEAFAEVASLAAAGDENYRLGQFDTALNQYRQALSKATALVERSKTLVADKVAEGEAAIAAGNRQRATAAFELALAVDPGSDSARQGLARAGVMAQTLPLLNQAREQMAAEQWQSAQQTLEKILALDGAHKEAGERLEQTRRALAEGKFTAAMNSGFAAMEVGDYSSAATHFQSAIALKPGDGDASASLAQARDLLQTRAVGLALTRARALEAEERWAEAADIYGGVLAGDGSVVEARVGQLRSRARADLHRDIEAILNDPLRLSSGSVYVRGQQLRQDARKIDAPGPVLEGQVARLEAALAKALQPVTVTLTSDNQTSVTVLRVGDMGAFDRRNVKLRPGRYVALGSRPGYRDVRVPFEVAAGESPEITVICTEPV